MRCALYRNLGIPCRRMRFFDLDAKKASEFLQVFIQPTGWVTITGKYDPAKPKEFPVANNELELYSPDAMQLTPRPRPAPSAGPGQARPAPLPELMQFRNVQIITSSTE